VIGIKVYIAAPWPIREKAIEVRRVLAHRGIQCTARWLTDARLSMDDATATMDLSDVARADVLVAINPAAWAEIGTGGRHVELGFALGLQKPIVLLGVRSNIFHYMNVVTVVDDSEYGLEALAHNVIEVVAAREIARGRV
jgi:nucleoside 2-deoxyribosyltransferase